MKKLVFVLVTVFVIFQLSGCADSNNSTDDRPQFNDSLLGHWSNPIQALVLSADSTIIDSNWFYSGKLFYVRVGKYTVIDHLIRTYSYSIVYFDSSKLNGYWSIPYPYYEIQISDDSLKLQRLELFTLTNGDTQLIGSDWTTIKTSSGYDMIAWTHSSSSQKWSFFSDTTYTINDGAGRSPIHLFEPPLFQTDVEEPIYTVVIKANVMKWYYPESNGRPRAFIRKP